MLTLYKTISSARTPLFRYFSKERAGKAIKPGIAIVLDGVPHRVMKIIQGKRGKGVEIFLFLYYSFRYAFNLRLFRWRLCSRHLKEYDESPDIRENIHK